MKLINKILAVINDPNVDFDERIYLIISTITEPAILIVFLGDIIIGEHIMEIAALGICLIVNPVTAYFCLRWHKVSTGTAILSLVVLFFVLPVVFFFGGGPDGGSILWFTFCTIYAGILLKGRYRITVLAMILGSAVLYYGLAWHFPDLICPHSRHTYYIDSLFSVMAVGIFAYLMVIFQNKLYIDEREKARAESSKAEMLNAAQNSFFANMSHEIRTPINTILGLNEMILREDISDEVAEDAENIQSAGKLLLSLINDILDMSKLESGQMHLVSDEYSTVDMIKDIVFMLAPKAREKHLEFEVDVAPDFPSILIGDEVRIKQILINVLNNAIKYTREGSVVFTADCSFSDGTGDRTGAAAGITDGTAAGTAAGDRNGAADTNSVTAVFTVRDTGIGVKKENIPYMFSAFKRIDEDETHYIEGTGLGLAIVKQLLELMGGKVSVDSVYTKGSTFVVEIPQKAADKKGVGVIDTFTGSSNKRREVYHRKFEAPEARILAVDDTVTNLMVVRKFLRSTKMLVDTAQSGEEALIKTMEKEYHIILMDHLMPEMDGIECAGKIREQKGGLSKNARMVALTANAGAENRKLFEEALFDAYLTKPVNGDDLEAAVYRLLPGKLVKEVEDRKESARDTVQWMSSFHRKRSVIITTESTADLPDEIVEKYRIPVIPYKINTRQGRFRDGMEIDANAMLLYIKDTGDSVKAQVPEAREYEEFFAGVLQKADMVAHIAISGSIPHSGYPTAMEAARSFDNVHVIDSLQISGGQGLMVMEACRMAEEGRSLKDIIEALDSMKRKIHSSFIADNLKYLGRSGQVASFAALLLDSVMARPVLTFKKGDIRLQGFYFGSRENSWELFMASEAKRIKNADRNVLFITYAGMTAEELSRIKALAERILGFRQTFLIQASAAVSANSGPKTFWLFYRQK